MSLIIVFPEIANGFLGFLFESDTPIELTIKSMFFVGMASDQLGKFLASFKLKN